MIELEMDELANIRDPRLAQLDAIAAVIPGAIVAPDPDGVFSIWITEEGPFYPPDLDEDE